MEARSVPASVPAQTPEDDPELAAMQAIVDALEPFGEQPDTGAVERTLRWACDRYAVSSS